MSGISGVKSAKSYATSENGETLGSENNNGLEDVDEDDNATRRTRGVENDPIFQGILGVFEGFQAEINNMGSVRMNYLKRTHKGGQ